MTTDFSQHPFAVACREVTVHDLAARAEVSHSTVRRWRGGLVWPSIVMLPKVCAALNADLLDLFPELKPCITQRADQ